MSNNTVIIAVDGGFYFFGTEVQGPAGYIVLENAAMFGGFGGGKGLPGVAKGSAGASVTLDRFDQPVTFPQGRVIFIAPSVDLYKSKIATIRG